MPQILFAMSQTHKSNYGFELPVTGMNSPSCVCLVVLSVSGKKMFEKVSMILKDEAKESIPLK